ncbi:uncharacterized protein LOC110812206 [Carica papaya]|uniref:uncharacterized protein LOC110812206 n=1 Tax=Carica papaya TaxID=3649 RepID=UPI000B8CDA0D|nr:uncharacterized protein LOC110812206 [Carica papaya]
MADYEVTGIDQFEDPFIHFALFSDYDPTTFDEAVKDSKRQKLIKEPDERRVNNTLYKQIVGSLMYLTATRPDIMHAVNLISRYMESPREMHLLVVKRILRYLQETINFGLLSKKSEQSVLTGFADSDYAGDLDDRKSTSGCVFMMGSGAISWSSRKQSIVNVSVYITVEYQLLSGEFFGSLHQLFAILSFVLQERLSRIEAAIASKKDAGDEDLWKTISELQSKLEDANAKLVVEQVKVNDLTAENEKKQYRIKHLVRALKQADQRSEEWKAPNLEKDTISSLKDMKL